MVHILHLNIALHIIEICLLVWTLTTMRLRVRQWKSFLTMMDEINEHNKQLSARIAEFETDAEHQDWTDPR